MEDFDSSEILLLEYRNKTQIAERLLFQKNFLFQFMNKSRFYTFGNLESLVFVMISFDKKKFQFWSNSFPVQYKSLFNQEWQYKLLGLEKSTGKT